MSSVEWLKPWPPARWFQLGTNGCVPEWATSAVLLFFRRFNPSPPRQKKATAEAVASVGPREREGRGLHSLPRRGAGMRPNHLTLSVIDTYSMMYENNHRQCI